MKRSKKENVVQEMHEAFVKSEVVILTDYKGLDVMAMNDLRRKLRQAEVSYSVVKNTLLVRASEGTGAELIKDCFKGPCAVAISYDDPVAPAKVLMEFAEDNEKLEVKVGAMNGKRMELSEISALAKLPSREALLGQVLSVMNGVPTSFVRALNGIPVNMLNVLQAIKEQKEAA